MIDKIHRFITHDFWLIQTEGRFFLVRWSLRILKTILATWRGFSEGKGTLRASALTFYSLLSIVPIVAIAFGIAKGFGLEEEMRSELGQQFEGQEVVVNQLVEFAQRLLENTKGGIIAGVGVALLFWTVLKLINHIEAALNQVWGVTQPRPLSRRFTDYLTMILVCPLFFMLSSSITLFLTTELGAAMTVFHSTTLSSYLPQLFKLFPFILSWVLFTFINIFIPNTKVRAGSAILAGVLSGTAYQLLQQVYVFSQIRVANYNAIYGSFAAIPLFILWLQASWLILLIGAEVAHAYQSCGNARSLPDVTLFTRRERTLLTLSIAHACILPLKDGAPLPSLDRLRDQFGLPESALIPLLKDLVSAKILHEVYTRHALTPAYAPACNIDTLTIAKALHALECQTKPTIPWPQYPTIVRSIGAVVDTFDMTVAASDANCLLRDVARNDASPILKNGISL